MPPVYRAPRALCKILGDTKWRESKLEESAYLLYQISPGNTRGESYAMQEMPFGSARWSQFLPEMWG